MITNAKQHTLTFQKGITNNPSDMLSTDNELAECVNLTYEDGEVKPIQKPELKFPQALKGRYNGKEYYLRIVFIHNFHTIENYICVANIEGKFKYMWFMSSDPAITLHDLEEKPTIKTSTPSTPSTPSSGEEKPSADNDSSSVYIENGYTGGTDSIPENIANMSGEFSEAKGLKTNVNIQEDKFQAVGKTLILSTQDGLRYYLWKNETYYPLGGDMPEIELQFGLWGDTPDVRKEYTSIRSYISDFDNRDYMYFDKDGKYISTSNSGSNPIQGDPNEPSNMAYKVVTLHLGYSNKGKADNETDSFKAVQDYVIGEYSATANLYKDKGRFLYPFWVRYAIRLYDGSHTHISNPILMLASVRRCGGVIPVIKHNGQPETSVTFQNVGNTWTIVDDFSNMYFKAKLQPMKLRFRFSNIPSELPYWSDIIKGVDIYVSQEVPPFNFDDEWNFVNPPYTGDNIFSDHVENFEYSKFMGTTIGPTEKNLPTIASQFYLNWMPRFEPKYLSDEEIIDKLKSTTTFFELSRIDIEELGDTYKKDSWNDVKIRDHVLTNITTQSQLEHDDYFSHTKYIPKTTFTYNNRLHLADVQRSIFEGFKHFMPLKQNLASGNKVNVYVRIETSSGTRYAKVSLDQPTDDLGVCYYFYYPDPNAKEVIYVFENPEKNTMLSFKLTEHPYLNGAYYLRALPDGTIPSFTFSDDTLTEDYEKNKEYQDGEYMPNQIFNTEADNPFVINAVGDNSIGNGEIIGLAANTYALSQGQAGQHPLIVFTTEGIYAMSVASDGTYSNIFNLSREICNNAKSITETDGAIYFTTDKGLMIMVGVQIQLVSLMLSGKIWKRFTSDNILPKDSNNKEDTTAFLDFLKDCSIAYDYKGQKLWIINPKKKYHYVYNIKSKIFTKMEDDNIRNVINFFPDTLLQLGDGRVFSFLNKPDINNDENLYNGKFITRPLKFDGALILETIYEIRNMFLTDGSVTMFVYGSNDLKHWNRLNSITGKPWKYYTLEYVLKNWKATDTFTASVVLLQTRRAELLR